MSVISIENKIENLKEVAGFVEKFGEDNHLDNKIVFDLNLILDELVTNIIHYSYNDNEKHLINISLEKTENDIKIKIIDDGKEFNPVQKEEADINLSLEEREIGGLGIHIVRHKTDNILYERKNNQNILSLFKKV